MRNQLRAWLTERLGYKAAALFFALVLWLIVSAEEPTEQLVPVRVAADTDSMRTLDGPLPVVRALVVGRARELLKLYATPPVFRTLISSDAPDVVRVELEPKDVFIPPSVEAIVRDVQPRTIALNFDVRAMRRVPVRSLLTVDVESDSAGWGRPSFEPDSVLVSGERDAVSRVAEVRTLAGHVVLRDTMPESVTLDTAGLGGVRVTPAAIAVRLRPVRRAPLDSTLSARLRR